MDEAFIIMQIGDPDMDRICDEVLVPTIEACNLKPRRVDRDNEGELLKSEIVSFIEGSQIIVADLTNERPNCYLEVGYAMGLGKKRNLILTVREDHHHRSPNYKLDGPHVHFDLEGYDLLLWDPEDLDAFRTSLEERIKRRLAIIEPPLPGEPDKRPIQRTPTIDSDWTNQQREAALRGLASVDLVGYMEAAVTLMPKGSWRQAALLSAVEDSQIKTFGWPIGIVLNRDPWRPQPTSEGVRAEAALGAGEGTRDRGSYDYWYLRQNGDFYLLQSLFEDERRPESLFFDTRIIRVTELLLFLARVYARLDVPDSTQLRLELLHGGLRGRELRAASPSRIMHNGRTTQEETVASTIDCTIAQLQTDLVRLVRELVDPLFVIFDFFEVNEGVVAQLVNGFVEGRVD
jgi:hypothetical protein